MEKSEVFRSTPMYETKSISMLLILLGFAAIFGTMGIYSIVESIILQKFNNGLLVMASVTLGVAVLLPIICRYNATRLRRMCYEFMNSVSETIGTWSLSYFIPFSCSSYTELDGNYLELTFDKNGSTTLLFYKFLSSPQTLNNASYLTRVIATAKIDKQTLRYTRVPLDTVNLQKWKENQEKWKSAIAQDQQLFELITSNSLQHFMMNSRRLEGIGLIDVAAIEAYVHDPSIRGRFLHGKALRIRIGSRKPKAASTQTGILQEYNEQLIEVGKRISRHVFEGIQQERSIAS